jgi:hypothetical protein
MKNLVLLTILSLCWGITHADSKPNIVRDGEFNYLRTQFAGEWAEEDKIVNIDVNIIDPNHFTVNSLIAGTVTFNGSSAVPVPAALWLFGTALIGMVGFSRQSKSI